MIQIDDLRKRYGKKLALDRFSMHVKQGELLGLLGPNGSGKTTLINCMLALLTFDQGRVKIFGKTMHPNALDIKRRIGVVPQELTYYANLTVDENLRYYCGLYIKERKKRPDLIDEAIRITGLEDYRKKFPRQLSGGLKRRLNIACGIVHQPELLLMDEPTVAVDAQSRHFILESIRAMNRAGATVIYTTHYLEEAEQLCDRMVIIDQGKIQAEGSLATLLGLIGTKEKLHLKVEQMEEGCLAALRGMEALIDIEAKGKQGEYLLLFSKPDQLSQVLELLKLHGVQYREFYSETPGLNDVFLELTGKELRDA